MDVRPLQEAYARLLTVARSGRFGAPPPGGWTAEHILAHVIASDRLLVSATAEVLAGGKPRYADAVARKRTYLDSIVAGSRDYLWLTAQVQATSMELLALARRLTDEQAGTEVVVSGEPQTLGSLLSRHAEAHLPEHAAQLGALRA